MQLAPLGIRNFEALGYNPSLTEPFLNAGFDLALTDFKISASPRLPIVRQGEEETVFVIIRDQLGVPIEGAVSQEVVDFPAEVRSFTLQPSDANGVARVSFEVPITPLGNTISIEVLVHHRGMTRSTRTSFIPWW